MAAETEGRTPNRSATISRDQLLALASDLGYRVLVFSTLVYLVAPLLIVVVLSLQGQPYGGWPPQSFTLQWYTTLPETLGYLDIVPVLLNSLQLAVATALISTTIGGLAAFAIVRYEFMYSDVLETILISPLIYPWIVIGLALLLFIGALNAQLGFAIRLSFWTLLAGHVLFTLPYPIRTIGANLQNYNLSLEEAAQNLGATELESYLRITLPLIQPGVLSGLVFTFVLSFNQYIISLFLAGPNNKTMPLLLFSLFFNTPPAQLAALATLLMCGILTLVFVAEYVAGISEFI